MVSDHPAFARYYQLVDALQTGYGQRMRIGADLRGPFGGGWTSELDVLTPLSLPAPQMARLHAMNIATWRTTRTRVRRSIATRSTACRSTWARSRTATRPRPRCG